MRIYRTRVALPQAAGAMRPAPCAAESHAAPAAIRARVHGRDKVMSAEPKDRLMTRAEVEKRVGLKHTAIYNKMRSGEFPEPYRVGRTAVRWSEREVDAWIAARPRSHGDGIHRARKAPDAPTS